jgi:23S rRNA G2445 N2-methylase RlmL
MTRRRSAEFSLDLALADPGFTPREADAPALVERLVRADPSSELVQAALLRLGLVGARSAAEHLDGAEGIARATLTAFVGRALARNAREPDPELLAVLTARLDDTEERVQRAAASALGKLRHPSVEAALVTALARAPSATTRRALVAALGKIGGTGALAPIAALEAGDAEVEKARLRARLMVERTALRAEPSAFDASISVEQPTKVILRCRAGLEHVLVGEIAAEFAPRVVRDAFGPGRVEATLSGAPAALLRARALLSFGFVLPTVELSSSSPADVTSAVVARLTSDACVRLLRRHTRGPLRYRLAWASGGKRRASTWSIAAQVAEQRPELVNDPTASPWQAVIHEAPRRLSVELVPRLQDSRFAYRTGSVPAASHPTLASALVSIAGVDASDVVWDPFVGSGMELCERHIAGPYRRLIGTDRDATALTIARANLLAVGAADAELVRADALTFDPGGVTLVLTNPPMGRRVLRGVDLGALLERFVTHAARVLQPSGKLVWISPLPHRTRLAAERAGLTTRSRQEVDMGGFSAEIQSFTKPHGDQ